MRRLTGAVALPFILIALHQTANAEDWRPVDPALLAQKAPTVEKDADVEGVFQDVRVRDVRKDPYTAYQPDLQTMECYIRMKVFTARGIEKTNKIQIVYDDANRIESIEGRTIKPDGSIVELRKDAVFDRTLLSIKGYRMKAKVFAFPAVEPGAVVEYRWRQIQGRRTYTRYPLQMDIPFQMIAYHVRQPADFAAGTMQSGVFNYPAIPPVKESGGFYGFYAHNMPAFIEEPHMPPHDSVRPFLLVMYSAAAHSDPDQYWKLLGQNRFFWTKELIKPEKDVKKRTDEVINGATNSEETVRRLFEFVRSEIKNTDDDISGLTSKQLNEALKEKNPAATLKRGTGDSSDILQLFGSMVAAAGLEVRIAAVADRSDFLFGPHMADQHLLSASIVAVKLGNEWRFYNPPAAYSQMGTLPWWEEGNSALIPDEKEPFFVTTPLSSPDKSLRKRTAKLQLSENGTIEGDVVLEYYGHLAADRKEYNDDRSPTEREEALKQMIKESLSTAEISNVQIENILDRDKPLVYRFHLRVVGYAQRTGKRLLLQPSLFEKELAPLFTSSQRKHSVYFSYPWSEADVVDIVLPAGFQIESPEGRPAISAGDAAKYELKLAISEDGRLLRCSRNFFFGGNNKILFSVKEYPLLKQLFEAVNEADKHTITLKQDAPARQ